MSGRSATARNVLIRARARIADREHWTKGTLAADGDGNEVLPKSRRAVRWCALGALYRVTSPVKGHRSASELLAAEIHGGPAFGDADYRITEFNDSHTHKQVLALYDRAIKATEDKS